MIDLFSIALEGAASWGIGRLLDAAVDCRCGKSTYGGVDNIDYNQFKCPDCQRALNQYVNATDHTVNRNGSIVSAAISGMHWPSWRNNFKLYYDLDVINSKYEEVVVELELSKFRGHVFERFESIQKPRHEYSYWEDTWIRIGGGSFPDESCNVAIDLKVYNTWGDLLDARRRLMEYTA